MNWIDLIIGLLLVYAFYKGFKNGLILELTSLLALILGLFLAYSFSDRTAGILDRWVDWSDTLLSIVAFLLTFIVVVILINLIGKAISKLIGMIALGLVNKLAGGIFGLIKVLLLISVLFVIADAAREYIDVLELEVVQTSLILDFYQRNIVELFPDIIDFIRESTPEHNPI